MGQPFGQQPQQAGGAHQLLQAGALVDQHGQSQQAQAFHVREGGEEKLAEEAIRGGARDIAFHLGARVFDQLVVLHSRGAGGHAGHAAQAIVHMQAEALVERSVALGGLLHHVDAAAGRIHLLAPEHVGGAGGEAEAAMYAVLDQRCFRRLVGVEVGGLCGFELRELGHRLFLCRLHASVAQERSRHGPSIAVRNRMTERLQIPRATLRSMTKSFEIRDTREAVSPGFQDDKSQIARSYRSDGKNFVFPTMTAPFRVHNTKNQFTLCHPERSRGICSFH